MSASNNNINPYLGLGFGIVKLSLKAAQLSLLLPSTTISKTHQRPDEGIPLEFSSYRFELGLMVGLELGFLTVQLSALVLDQLFPKVAYLCHL